MKKVLRYKTNFLNKSETFIDRLIQNHNAYQPVALCYRKRFFCEDLTIYKVPRHGIEGWFNFAAFHSNTPLPYYKEIIRQEKPNLIHAHFGYDAVKLIHPAKSQNIPLLVSFYGSDVSRLPSELGWKRRYRKLAHSADHFIAVTDFMKSQLIELGFPKEKISIVRFEIDIDKFAYREHSENPKKIIMVGRMVEKKGFEYAIQAISNINKMGMNPEVNIYGYGLLMKSLKERTRNLKVNGSIRFHGYQPIDSIMKAYDEHAIMIAPSVTAEDGNTEGLPNTILESMAKGTPVVASKHAAISEVIKDKKTGFLFNEKDVDSLTELLRKILEDEFDLNSIRGNARSLIEKKIQCIQVGSGS
jgi:glycosyltransferase involved in cell wall biosynthesis